MRGFVLAAGFGTRLRPLTDHIPKALVPVCGKPLLERVLDSLESFGIHDLAVNAHYLPDCIEGFRSRRGRGFGIFHERDKIRGTGGAFNVAREFLRGDDAFVVWNVDIVSDVDLGAAAGRFLESGALCGLLGVPGGLKKTVLYARETGRYIGTPRDTDPFVDCAGAEYIGIALYRREFLEFVRPDDFSIVPVWKRAVTQGADIRVFEIPGVSWRDTGTPAALASIHFDVCTGRLRLPVPEWMNVDTVGRRAYNRALDERAHRFGHLSWVEPAEFPARCTVDGSVVFSGAMLGPGRNEVRDCIVSAWGDIAI